jgi:hypothetical protein
MLVAVAAADPKARDIGADEITDVYRGLDTDQATLLALRLVTLRLQEADLDCQESQLNAMGVLKGWFEIDKSIFEPLRVLRAHDLGPQDEYLSELFDEED